MFNSVKPLGLSFGLSTILTLAACDGAPSATAARSHDGSDAGRAVQQTSYDQGAAPRAAEGDGARPSTPRADLDADTPRYHGKPLWAANRNHSGQDNADYQFKKNGADLGAASEDDFVAKAHDFIDHPPKGAETLKRNNGDVLIYDAKANIFAVASKDGAPRTLFKPRDGESYWAKQKENLDKPYSSYRRTARKSSGGDDQG